MKINWKPLAIKSRRKIATYIQQRFGEKSKKNFLSEVHYTILLLKNNPYLAPIDPLFESRAKTYRSILINALSKMVYYIEGETITVVAFWDCRSNPITQAQQVKD